MQVTHEQAVKLFERDTVAEIIPSRETFERRLLSGDPLHVYFGIDPTSDKLHLGHVQNILFLEDLRALGAKTTLLFGSFTGTVGDPSDRETTRSEISADQVRENMRTWRKQVTPLIDLSWRSGARIDHNDRWYGKFSLERFLPLLREVTVQQLLERDMFRKRLDEGKPLHAHEVVYPILQGYDSVALRADAELCGTDQTFNALVGRTLAKRFLEKEKFVITMNLLQANGVLMSKSSGTGVFVDIEKGGADRMFGAVMAVPDSFIIPIYKGCTRISMSEIAAMDVAGGAKTRDEKMRLAREIVAMFWGEEVSREASDSYARQFRERAAPDSAPNLRVRAGDRLLDIVAEHAAASRSDARRKFLQGAVSVDGKKVSDIAYGIREKDSVMRVGRRVFRLRSR